MNLKTKDKKRVLTSRLLKNASEPQISFVIGTAPSKQVFFDFFNSPERLAIQQAIIVKQPIIIFLESV